MLTSVGAGAAEIAWGFVPIAPDLLDLGKEAFWQPVVNEQNPDYWVVAFSAFGLLSDAGYIALPAGAVGNAAAAVGKFIARLEKRFPGLVRGIVTGAGSVAASARAIADYAKRIPAPPPPGRRHARPRRRDGDGHGEAAGACTDAARGRR